MFRIPFTITNEDYLAFSRYHLSHTPSGRKLLVRLRLIAPVIGVFALFLLLLAGARPLLLWAEAVTITLLSLLLLPLAPRIMLGSIQRQLVRMGKEGHLPYTPEGELQFGEDSLLEITPDAQTRISYSRIERIGVAPEALYLYSGAAQAYILPFSTLADADTKERLLAFVQQKTGLSFS